MFMYLAEVKDVAAKLLMIHAQFTVSALAIVETTSHIHNAHDDDKVNDN